MARSGDSNEVVARWEGGWRATVTAGPFSFAVDEPEEVGGTFTGPMPTEYLLGSAASCYALALAWCARKRGIELPDLSVSAIGEYDGPSFSGIRLRVSSSLPAEKLEPLLAPASRACYVSNTLARSPRVEVNRNDADG
ncbi:OsmC family protein [Streptosporangium sp. NBC_01755]|uniref:OsmC family protein n=1 Tax=unclassified Streptosporangium TaxID=2632669 RepID=UPI002DD8186C|nr:MULTISPECIES: OsmC family protein [unclassified Streptosporangium]WSA26453.1 OsmC family protein [Streptosporangium sp. NBC_01810]WSD02117.1 OsmC family protein [Streptosporangium sp. NBC_01755]